MPAYGVSTNALYTAQVQTGTTVTTPGTRVRDLWLTNPDGTDGEQLIANGVVVSNRTVNIATTNFTANNGTATRSRARPSVRHRSAGRVLPLPGVAAGLHHDAPAEGGLGGTVTSARYLAGGSGRHHPHTP